MNKRIAIINNGILGIYIADYLLKLGQEVYIINKTPYIFPFSYLKKEIEEYIDFSKLLEVYNNPNIKIFTNSYITKLEKNKKLKIKIKKFPKYVLEDICNGCRQCIINCPVQINNDKPISIETPFPLPYSCVINKRHRPPCVRRCPVHINIQGYIALISAGKYKQAFSLIKESIPLPSVCGYVCFHPCEQECRRKEVDEPIAINALKRFVSDYNRNYATNSKRETINRSGEKVAIIGSGPAGLTAAHDLALKNYKVTIFERLPLPGGLLRTGIPEYRLPKDILQYEINDICNLGVEIKTNVHIGKDKTIDDLFAADFKAIFIATGAQSGLKLGVKGENLPGVEDAISFLQKVSLSNWKYKLNSDIKKVVVVGGGNSAIDSARVALRCGAEKVYILYRRTRKEIPASSWEIEEALEEGIQIEFLVAPVEIIGENNKVKGIKVQKMKLGEPDSSGRKTPIPIPGSEYEIETDMVIIAIGQKPELTVIKQSKDILINKKNNIVVDKNTYQTNRKGVFAGGDFILGPSSVIEAIKTGKEAAIAIDKYIKGEEISIPPHFVEQEEPEIYHKDELKNIKKQPRQKMINSLPKNRIKDFQLVEQGFTEEMAKLEANRCLNCGICCECGECVKSCDLNALDHRQKVEELDLEIDDIIVTSESEILSVNPDNFDSLVNFENRDTLDIQLQLQLIKSLAIISDLVPISYQNQVNYKNNFINSSINIKEEDTKIGVFICGCGGSISNYLNIDDILEFSKNLPNVKTSKYIHYSCVEHGIKEIKQTIKKLNINKIVLGACACCNLDQVCSNCSLQRNRIKEKIFENLELNRYVCTFINIREHGAWLYPFDKNLSTKKVSSLIYRGILQCNDALPLTPKSISINKNVLIIGSSSEIIIGARILSEDIPTYLILTEKEENLSEDIIKEYKLLKESSNCVIIVNPNILENNGFIGNFITILEINKEIKEIKTGVIVIDSKIKDKLRKKFNLKCKFSGFNPFETNIKGILSFDGVNDFLVKYGLTPNTIGKALSTKVRILLNKNELLSKGRIAKVNTYLCRGCGQCIEVCSYNAISLKNLKPEILVSDINEFLCEGCEICVTKCPTGAISIPDHTKMYIDKLLETVR